MSIYDHLNAYTFLFLAETALSMEPRFKTCFKIWRKYIKSRYRIEQNGSELIVVVIVAGCAQPPLALSLKPAQIIDQVLQLLSQHPR